jgi:hypothetical protein
MRAVAAIVVLALGAGAAHIAAQATPQPFPGASTAGQAPPRPAATAPPPSRTPQTLTRSGEAPPTEVTLGVSIYPSAQYLGSYNAGQGQRYYLFGSTASFADLVAYYRGVLKDRGELVFDAPATHMFDIGRFREESMAFPPSVTVKDYTWGGKGGYLNPTPGAQPARYPTIIQIVPATAPTP